ncbi:MAG TPA: hypothetical protein VIN12_10665 [Candidatus Dormibacteraeota bacterium]
MNHPASQPARPPLWLAAAAVAAGWGAVYDIGRWIAAFVTFPAHEDVRIYYVAAQAGLRYGWSTIYALALGLPAPQLIWDAGWLAILVVSSFFGSGASGPATRPAISSDARAGT